MQTTNGNTEDPTWEMPKFHFEVDFGTQITGIHFEEVSGMENETQIIEYKDNFSPIFSTVKMPGIPKFGNVTLKRGLFKNDINFKNWVKKIKMNIIEKQEINIKLNDEEGNTFTEWVIMNAFPVKMKNINLQTDVEEVLVDTLEIKHEGLVIVNS